jgi:hypothetical protein
LDFWFENKPSGKPDRRLRFSTRDLGHRRKFRYFKPEPIITARRCNCGNCNRNIHGPLAQLFEAISDLETKKNFFPFWKRGAQFVAVHLYVHTYVHMYVWTECLSAWRNDHRIILQMRRSWVGVPPWCKV